MLKILIYIIDRILTRLHLRTFKTVHRLMTIPEDGWRPNQPVYKIMKILICIIMKYWQNFVPEILIFKTIHMIPFILSEGWRTGQTKHDLLFLYNDQLVIQKLGVSYRAKKITEQNQWNKNKKMKFWKIKKQNKIIQKNKCDQLLSYCKSTFLSISVFRWNNFT